MKTIAIHRRARSSPQKTRIIANIIRGKKATKALEILQYTNKKSAKLIKKVLQSAIANAKHNNNINENELKITKIFIDEGPRIKRILPRAKGRADHIIKRTSHITVVVSD